MDLPGLQLPLGTICLISMWDWLCVVIMKDKGLTSEPDMAVLHYQQKGGC